MSKKPRPNEGMHEKAKRLTTQKDQLLDKLELVFQNTYPWSEQEWPNGLQQMDRLSDKIDRVLTYIDEVLGGIGRREDERYGESHGLMLRPTVLAKEPKISMATLWICYDKGYQVGYEEALDDIEAETKDRGRFDVIIQQGRWLPPRIRTRADFAPRTAWEFTSPYEDHNAWCVGYCDGQHVAEVDAGTPCDDPDCRLCKQQPSNAQLLPPPDHGSL